MLFECKAVRINRISFIWDFFSANFISDLFLKKHKDQKKDFFHFSVFT